MLNPSLTLILHASQQGGETSKDSTLSFRPCALLGIPFVALCLDLS